MEQQDIILNNEAPAEEETVGRSNLTKVRKMKALPTKIVHGFTMPKIRIREGDIRKSFFCTCCGKSYSTLKGNFLKAGDSILWQANKGYMPICKNCADIIYKGLTDFFCGNEEKSLQQFCGYMDMFYDEQASAMSAAYLKAGCSRVGNYASKINIRQVKARGSTYLDTIKNDLSNAATINSPKEIPIQDHEENESAFKVTKDVLKKWGYGLKIEEYEWLDEQEQDWRSRVECKTKAQEELIRTICIAQLNIQRAQQGSGLKIAEAMKTFQDLLASCNLQPRQNAEGEVTDQNTFGTLIKRIENERPIPEPDEEWADVDGIKKYIDTWFLGHLCNLTHVNNDCEAEYRKELEKYTVKPPVYEDEENSVDMSLLDKYSNKGTEKKDE